KSQRRLAIKTCSGHCRQPRLPLTNEHNLRLENVIEPRRPSRPPILSVERTKIEVQLLLPGDRLKGLDHHAFQSYQIRFCRKAECQHAIQQRSEDQTERLKI